MRYNGKLLFGLLALVFLLACTQTPEKLVEQRAKDATVLMITGKADGSIGTGSGFFVESDKIATNIHVVAGDKIVFAVGTKKVYNIKKVTGYHPELDLVVLKVSGKGKPLELGEGKIGDPVFAVGYPGGGYSRTEGIVHYIRESDKQLRLVARSFPKNRDPVLTPGNSGGPVLNNEEQVTGIAIAGDEDFNSAIASSSLDALLKSDKEENLSDWQEENPILAYTYYTWADKKVDSENYAEAIKGFNKAIELYPLAVFYINRGIAKSNLGRYQETIQDDDEAIRLIPDDFTIYYNRGIQKLKNGDYVEAIQDFDKGLKFNIDHAESYRNRGIAKTKNSKPDYQSAIQDFTDAINRKTRDVERAESYYNRGNAKLQSEDYDGAIEDSTEAIRLKDDFVDAYFVSGAAKVERPNPDYGGAIKDYNKIITLNPEDYRAYYNRGIAKKALGQNEDAKQDSSKVYYYWGKADSNSGDYQAAIEKFDEAIAIAPNYVKVYHYRGEAYRLRGEKEDYQKAISDYDKVVALKPNYTEIHAIYNNRGLAKTAVNNYDEAVKDYTRAIELKSNYAEAYYNRGNAYRLRGQKDGFQRAVGNENFKKAVEDYKKAIGLKYNFADAYYKLGFANRALGEHGTAKENFASAYYFWGKEAHKGQQYQKAIDNFNLSLEESPDFSLVHIIYDARGRAKMELGKSKAGLGNLEDARNLYKKAIKDSNEAIKLYKEDALYYKIRGETIFYRAAIRDHNDHNGMIEDYESAIKDFEKAIKRESDSTAYIHDLIGLARCFLGYAKANQGNSKEARKQYNLALKDFKEAIKLDGNNAAYYKGLGLANAALGKAKAAIDAFEKAKQLKETKAGN